MLRVDELPHGALRALALFFGLVWGSFLNVVIHRVPRDESVVKPGSHCPACGKPIAWWNNIPVFSWLFMLGKARCCGVKVSARYPLVEALGGAASIAVLELTVFTMPQASVIRATCIYLTDFSVILALIAAAFIDFEWMYIPDTVTIGGTVLGIATSSFRGMSIVSAVIAAAAGFLITYVPFVLLYRMARGRPGMGLGDAKLLMMAGAFFGVFGVLWALLAGAIQGSLAALVLWLVRGKIQIPDAVKEELAELRKAAAEGDEEAKEALEEDPLADEEGADAGLARMAFGPFLAMAFIEMMLFHDFILDYAHQVFFM